MAARVIEASIELKDCSVSEEQIIALFELLDSCPSHAIPTGDVSIALVDEKTICELHDEFLDDPSPTDVITFPGDPEADFAGEIVVSYDQAIKEHNQHGNSVEQELRLYLVHGWLHLAGEDDLADDTRTQMREAEKTVLAWLDTQGKT